MIRKGTHFPRTRELLVTKELWHAANAGRRVAKDSRTRIFCARCGFALQGQSTTKQKKSYRYVCGGYNLPVRIEKVPGTLRLLHKNRSVAQGLAPSETRLLHQRGESRGSTGPRTNTLRDFALSGGSEPKGSTWNSVQSWEY